MPSVDPTKVVYYSGFSSYKNVGVYELEIATDGVSIGAGLVRTFTSTINVSENSNYATIQIQANESVGSPPRTPSALRWQQYPAAKIVSIALNTDPYGAGTLDCFFFMELDGDEVSFSIQAVNSYDQPISLVPTNIGVRYAIHSTEG